MATTAIEKETMYPQSAVAGVAWELQKRFAPWAGIRLAK
jgi:hypothetical protein